MAPVTARSSVCILNLPEEVCWAKRAKYKLRRGQARLHGKFPNFLHLQRDFLQLRKSQF